MKKIILCVLLVAAIAGSAIWVTGHRSDRQQAPITKKNFDMSHYSTDDPGSPWVVVNKQRPLIPFTYTPDDLTTPAVPLRLSANTPEMQLRKDAAEALEKLVTGARKDGIDLMLSSAYRSYTYQRNLYDYYVDQQGQAVADTQSARPGHSEHQTGLAADIGAASRICEVEDCFGDMPEGQWLAAHAVEYGFIIRYPKNMQTTTGYIYEPWHLRYVGAELSQEVKARGYPTLEAFFGLAKAPDYK